MTNAVETPAVDQIAEARKTLDNQTASLGELEAKLKDADSAFLDMIKTAGANMDVAQQLAVADARTTLAKSIETLKSQIAGQQSRLDSLLKSQRMAGLEKPVDSFRNAVKSAFERAGLATLMHEAGAGDVMTLSVNVVRGTNEAGEETVTVNVSSAFRAGTAIKQATSNGAASGGSRGSNRYVADGVEYETRAYLEKFAQGAIDAKQVNWTGDPLDSVGLTHRAVTLAGKLGHTVTKYTPAPTSA